MTGVLERPVAIPPGPQGGRRRRIVLGLVVALIAVGLALWALLPGLLAVGGSDVLFDARPFSCAIPADVTTFRSGDGLSDDDAVVVPAIRMRPGLDCTMTVIVRNDSDATVAVDSITLPLAGPANGVGIRADQAQTQGFGPSGGSEAVDAVFDYAGSRDSGGPYPVSAHSVQRFVFHLRWADGCMSKGSADTITQAPVAVLSAGPWHLEKRWNGVGYAFLGGDHTVAASCGH